jgi:hypothetical protein
LNLRVWCLGFPESQQRENNYQIGKRAYDDQSSSQWLRETEKRYEVRKPEEGESRANV